SMGVEPQHAIRNLERTEDIIDFLAEYRAPRFSGPIDRAKASRGEAIYRQNCSFCHGVYSGGLDNVRLVQFPNPFVPIEKTRTDPVRLNIIDKDLTAALNNSPFQSLLVAAPTGGYVATRLTGLWATAPYLHNGSVPTLWALMHPDQRPVKFEVGGH